MWEGTVVSIHIAPEASAPMQSITEARAFPGRGLEGDRYFAGTGFYSKKSSYGGREVTLIEIEAVGALFGGVLNAEGERFSIELAAADTRRNIATSRVHSIILSTVNSGSAPCDENLVTVLSEHSGPASECGAGISVVLAGQRDRKQRIKQIVARERNGRTDTSRGARVMAYGGTSQKTARRAKNSTAQSRSARRRRRTKATVPESHDCRLRG